MGLNAAPRSLFPHISRYVTAMHAHVAGENVCSSALYSNFDSLWIPPQNVQSLRDNVGQRYGPLRSQHCGLQSEPELCSTGRNCC